MVLKVFWPSRYRRDFVSTRGTALVYSLLLTSKYLAGTPARAARTAGVAAVGLAAGVLLSALDKFAVEWQVYLVGCIAPLVAGVILGVFVTYRRSLDLYRPGSHSQLVVANGTLYLELNSHHFKSELSQLTDIGRIMGLAILIYEDHTVLLVPWRVLPGMAVS